MIGGRHRSSSVALSGGASPSATPFRSALSGVQCLPHFFAYDMRVVSLYLQHQGSYQKIKKPKLSVCVCLSYGRRLGEERESGGNPMEQQKPWEEDAGRREGGTICVCVCVQPIPAGGRRRSSFNN